MDPQVEDEKIARAWTSWIRNRFISLAKFEFKAAERQNPGAMDVLESALKLLGTMQLQKTFFRYLDKSGGELVWRGDQLVKVEGLAKAARAFADDVTAEYRRHLRT